MKTVQLRRYQLVPGEKDAFVEWWSRSIPSIRAEAGFTIEFAYWDEAAGEFVWAVSTPGDAEAFAAIESSYLASDGRKQAFEGVPNRVAEHHVTLVDVIR
jgi:hypothetical protein